MADLNDAKLEEYIQKSDTCNFYKNKTLLITGVTGFCGKVFFEKIARVLFPVKRVYLLIRSKKDQTAQDRLNELLQSKIFTFHQYSKHQFDKFIAINGDCSQPDMGLSDEDKIKLITEVDIVFHCAASVKFDAPVAYNFKQNTLGSKYMLDLARKFNRIEHYVYVSTAFVNCQLQSDGDQILDFEEDIDVIIDKLQNAKSDEEMTEIAKPYFGGRPNSYILTKALAESYVKKHCSFSDDENGNEKNNNEKNNNEKNDQCTKLRSLAPPSTVNTDDSNSIDVQMNNLRNDLVSGDQIRSNKRFETYVVRPSVVYNSKAEPTIGWIDSFNGPSGFSIFIFLGLIRCVKMNFDQIFQCVPVDYLANLLISVPYLYSANQSIEEDRDSSKSDIKVLTVTFDQVRVYNVLVEGFQYLRKYPSLYMLRVPEVPPMFQPKETIFLTIKRYILEVVWAHAMDFLFMITGMKNKISIVRLHQKYVRACELMSYFMCNKFYFPTANYKKLLKLQGTTDAILFDFDFENYDCNQIASSYVLGTRRFLLNEPDSTIPLASTKFKVQQFLSSFVTFLFWIISIYMITCVLKFIFNF